MRVCVPQIPKMPESYFNSADIAAAGGLVENLEPDMLQQTYREAMTDALVSAGIARKA